MLLNSALLILDYLRQKKVRKRGQRNRKIYRVIALHVSDLSLVPSYSYGLLNLPGVIFEHRFRNKLIALYIMNPDTKNTQKPRKTFDCKGKSLPK